MKFSLAEWIIILVTSMVTFPALADESGNQLYNSTRNTLVISVGRSTEQNGCNSPWLTQYLTTPACNEKGSNYGFAYENHITKNWGVELSFGQTGNATGNGRSIFSGAPAPWSMRALTSAIYGTGKLPLGNSFSVKGKIGLARTHFSEDYQTTKNGTYYVGVPLISDSKNTLAYGIGMQYDINRDIGLVLQYENLGSFDEYSLYQMGTPPKIRLSEISMGLALKW